MLHTGFDVYSNRSLVRFLHLDRYSIDLSLPECMNTMADVRTISLDRTPTLSHEYAELSRDCLPTCGTLAILSRKSPEYLIMSRTNTYTDGFGDVLRRYRVLSSRLSLTHDHLNAVKGIYIPLSQFERWRMNTFCFNMNLATYRNSTHTSEHRPFFIHLLNYRHSGLPSPHSSPDNLRTVTFIHHTSC